MWTHSYEHIGHILLHESVNLIQLVTIPAAIERLWETHNLSPCHVILHVVVNVLATEKFSPSPAQQSHFGKKENDQINSFMELSDLIKLVYYILKLINGA